MKIDIKKLIKKYSISFNMKLESYLKRWEKMFNIRFVPLNWDYNRFHIDHVITVLKGKKEEMRFQDQISIHVDDRLRIITVSDTVGRDEYDELEMSIEQFMYVEGNINDYIKFIRYLLKKYSLKY